MYLGKKSIRYITYLFGLSFGLTGLARAQVLTRGTALSLGVGGVSYQSVIPKISAGVALTADAEFFIHRQLSLVLEGQFVNIGGDGDVEWGRKFNTNFYSLGTIGRVYLGRFNDHIPQTLGGVLLANGYAGAGIGYVGYGVNSITRDSQSSMTMYGADSGGAVFLSLHLGTSVDIKDKLDRPSRFVTFDVGYKVTTSNQLSGYAEPAVIQGKWAYDKYLVVNVGFGFYLGRNIVYFKEKKP